MGVALTVKSFVDRFGCEWGVGQEVQCVEKNGGYELSFGYLFLRPDQFSEYFEYFEENEISPLGKLRGVYFFKVIREDRPGVFSHLPKGEIRALSEEGSGGRVVASKFLLIPEENAQKAIEFSMDKPIHLYGGHDGDAEGNWDGDIGSMWDNG